MTSWMKERDDLLQQTLAFVAGVAAQRPAAAVVNVPEANPNPPPINPDPTPAVLLQDTNIATVPQPDSVPPLAEALAESVQDEPAIAAPAPTFEMRPSPRIVATRRPIDVVLPERDVISQRVARFREGQRKLMQDRDARMSAVQARIRIDLGTDTHD